MSAPVIRLLLALSLACLPAAAQQQSFGARLDGTQEVPPNASASVGSARLSLNPDDSLTYEVSVSSALSATAAHIHAGVAGSNGAVQFTLSGGPSSWSGTTAPLAVGQLASLQAGGLYINVHSAAFPCGEIRGQVRPLTPFAGSWHLPKGDASLSVGASGLTAANLGSGDDGVWSWITPIGSSGMDGVSVFSTSFDVSPATLPVGTTQTVRLLGGPSAAGPSAQELVSVSLTGAPGDVIVAVDFAGIGAATYTAVISKGGIEQALLPAVASGDDLHIGPCPEQETVLKYQMGPDGQVWNNGSVTVFIPCDALLIVAGGPPIQGDAIQLIPDVAAPQVQVQSIEVVGDGLSAFGVAGESLVFFGHDHTATGDVLMQAASGTLQISSFLGSSMNDGVLIDLPDSERLELGLDLPAAPPGIGSSLRFETVGMLDGIEDQSLGELTLTRAAGSWSLLPTFDAISSPTHRLQLLQGGAIVLDLPGHSGVAALAADFPDTLGKLGGATECIVMTFPTLSSFTIDGFAHAGDELRLLAETTSTVGHKSGCSLWLDAALSPWQLAVTSESVVPTAWSNLGCALAGTTGLPYLQGSGSLEGGTQASVSLSNTAPSTICGLFLSLSSTPVPFKGGVLKAFPFLGPPTILVTSPVGSVDIPFNVPALPLTGLELFVQYAVLDAGAVAGVALSNCLRALFP